ncbi:MAG: lysine--tRNA ligase [Patescibacteria group bacterium]|jgi:lysyl-tRNA synthetase class 2
MTKKDAQQNNNNELSEESVRLEKLQRIKDRGIAPYPEKFDKTHSLAEALGEKEGKKVAVAGRLMTFRDMGKLTFAHLQDASGKMQIVFKQDELGNDEYKFLLKNIDLGDFLGIEGEAFTTQKGERSILVKKWTFLGKALRPLPEKWHGLQDQEAKYRQRYLDLISNRDTLERFILRSNFIRALREFYWQEGFYEVETPTLLHSATGAAARPYKTHNNALDIDVVLRISHELPLKELIVGGFEKIFEIGKAFRNEGHDPSHLPEHTHIEHYCAYWNYEDNIAFTEKMFDYLFDKLNIPKKITIQDKDGNPREVDFTTPWKKIDFIETVNKDSGLDIMSYTDVKDLRADCKKKEIEIEDAENMGLSTLIDNIYKKFSRPKIVNPTILYHYPKVVQPLARVNDSDNRTVDQFQLVVNGWEIVKAYSELVDPIDQRQRFVEQAAAKAAGDEEAMDVDEEYLTAMEHGMPPISGWGMGVDRLFTLLTQQPNLRDSVLFPLMKPKDKDR